MTSIADRRDDEQASIEAGAWIARLNDDAVSEHDGVEFDAWLAADRAHATAYRQALVTWHAFEAQAEAVAAELDRRGPVAGARRDTRPAAQRRGHTRRWLAGAGGFAVAAGLAVTVLPPMLLAPAAQTYVTGKGQHQRVTLADGSVVDLNAETRMTVRLASSKRQVTLGDGEAIFDVTSDPSRPFTVAAAGRVVRVVGTQFDVRSRGGALTVTVARGKVQVRPADRRSAGGNFVLTPGQTLAVAASGLEAVKVVDPQEAFGWRAGRLVYRDAPLSAVVADLNQQFVEQIEIGDASLGAVRINGVIVLDDPNAVIERLSLMLPIRSVPSDRGLLLLRK
jgi:transmembrane sensor